MAGKKKFPPAETPIIAAVKKLLAQASENVEKRLSDVTQYLTGALDQLMFQQAQHMSVQAAIIEYLNDHLAPGSEATIRGIMETNIAKAKAEREEREKRLNEEAEQRKAAAAAEAARLATLRCGCCGTGEDVVDDGIYGVYCNPCLHTISTDTGPCMHDQPADIAPAAPADAPADNGGT